MFGLINVVSSLVHALTTDSQSEANNDSLDEETEETVLTDASELNVTESLRVDLVSTNDSMVESFEEASASRNNSSFAHCLRVEHLHIQDSEDWDAEIEASSSTGDGAFSDASGGPVFKPASSTTNQFQRNQATLATKMVTHVVDGNTWKTDHSFRRTNYFDNEVFPQMCGKVTVPSQTYQNRRWLSDINGHFSNDDNKSEFHKSYERDKNEFAIDKHQIYSDVDVDYYSDIDPYAEDLLYENMDIYDPWDTKIPPTHFEDTMQDTMSESLPEIPSAKNDKQMFPPSQATMKRQIVSEIMTNYQGTVPHDVHNEHSADHPDQTFSYETMFQWDFMEKLTKLDAIFNQADRSTFLAVLQEILNISAPYSFLLYVVENSYSNVSEGKKSLAHIALTQFDSWRESGLFNNTSPTDIEKDRALWIVTTRKLYLFDLCNKVFHLDGKGNKYLQRHVYYLLQTKKCYKEAVTIAYKLNLQPCFQPMEILFPLLILNKVQLVESYIAGCPWQQRAFVSMLDKLCQMSDEQLDELTSDIIPSKPTTNKVTQTSLIKLGERIVKKFSLNPQDFPELFKAKNIKGLSYLLHQRQKDKGSSVKKWDDLIERCVGNNLSLQRSLVELLTESGDDEDARRWARFYQLSSDRECNESQNSEPYAEDWDDELRNCSSFHTVPERDVQEEYHPRMQYLSLDIPTDRIFFVDDEKSLHMCQEILSKRPCSIGFDAEWKPQMCQAGLAQRLSIVQLSLRDRVFILDVIAIANEVPRNTILSFGNAVFANANVLKLGYGVESDFKALIATLPILEKSIKKMKSFVDLCTFSRKLFQIPAVRRRVDETTKSLTFFGHLSEKGLSLLVQQCLGSPLDKTYQLSDWEQRPLLPKQVEYAALDARCLIDVYDVLTTWMQEENVTVDLEECTPNLPWLFPKRNRRKQGKVLKQPKPGTSLVDLDRLNKPVAHGSPNSPRNFRVVVDNMLQGLGRYLRCCGVDVVMLANDDTHDKAAKIARRDDRVLLTTGTPYYTLRSQVPLGQCMCVPVGSAKEQILAVFKHFNIQVNTSDIFSRCQACNGNEYIKVGSVLMREAYIKYYERKNEALGQAREPNMARQQCKTYSGNEHMRVGSLSMPEAYIKYNASENEVPDLAREQNMARQQYKISNRNEHTVSMPEAYIKYGERKNEALGQAREQNMAHQQRKISNRNEHTVSMPKAYIKYDARENEALGQAHEQNMAHQQHKQESMLINEWNWSSHTHLGHCCELKS
ncbi:exonuclease mut-7 homolog isoform X2 [Xenia sp. Carnegie-2017]|uniref:exonuclease mut-7 homolog isoform X2 n=1 Tax=Xenia sp. Carnegie-2017 TaxID=2897299 RepID=UPI001F037676|nr:exonuclease mut-7 homolog isoform X2 [Xenia sp. Carnegie-2017]